jgi:hypothetical protein
MCVINLNFEQIPKDNPQLKRLWLRVGYSLHSCGFEADNMLADNPCTFKMPNVDGCRSHASTLRSIRL